MIVIIILAALCTGILCGAASFYWLGIHETIALMIAVGITGAVNFSILAYVEKARNESYEFNRKLHMSISNGYKALLDDKSEMLEACCRDLKKADIDCQFCKHSNYPELGKKCLDSDCSCEECGADCPCRGCRSNSNYKWRGICDDNHTEE